jgi:hypothetical protein
VVGPSNVIPLSFNTVIFCFFVFFVFCVFSQYTTAIGMKSYTRKLKARTGNKSTRRSPGSGLIGPLRRGELAKHGYSHVQKMSVSDRHEALDSAVKEFGGLGVWRKLNAVAVYTKRTAPGASRVFKEDMAYIRSKYGLKAF